jgi:hypothetical protein
MDIGRGLWSIAVWGAIGTLAPMVALRAGDEFSMWVLGQATGATGADVRLRLISAFSLAGIPAPGAVVILGIVVMVSVFLQALLMLLRELAVLLIAILLQTAAASTLSRPANGGVGRLLGWSAALITYKPIVALIYSIAFLIIGSEPDPSPRPFFIGTAALWLSLIAFPAALRFFQRSVRILEDGWRPRPVPTTRIDARALGTMSGSGGPAGAHARYLTQSMYTPPPIASGGPSSLMSHNRPLPGWLAETGPSRSDLQGPQVHLQVPQVLGATVPHSVHQGSELHPEPDGERRPRE